MAIEAQNSPHWDREAAYAYYDHGPLARTVLGEHEVQGIDNVYTLQGWIKGVNSNVLGSSNDPGKDGAAGPNAQVAVDAFSYSLHYFNGDYLSIGTQSANFIATQAAGSNLGQLKKDLYNGNIGAMVTTITHPTTRAILPLGNVYEYDQLNRLATARSFDNLDLNTNTWGSAGAEKYYNAFTYDANGNILTQLRKDQNNNTIDSLSYKYHKNSSDKRVRNRLYSVHDTIVSSAYTDDIDNMSAFIPDGNINIDNNYSYDAEGRLIKDVQEGITNIVWRVDSKVKTIYKLGASTPKIISFDYDAMGHRIAKHVFNGSGTLERSTYYTLDAQGNAMVVYEREVNASNQTITFTVEEKMIYGSKRLGVLNDSLPMLGTQNNTYSQKLWSHVVGKRTYELSNHLGNVLSVISDKVIPHQNGSTVDYFLADIVQSTDYSAFHAPLSERTLYKSNSTLDYRFGGSNGQEKVDEISGNGNHYTAEFWEYDSRLGRRWNMDPIVKEHRSPYDVFSNNPIIMVDPNGDDDYYNSDGTYNSKMSKKYNDNGTHNIYVLSADGKSKTLLADMPVKTENDRKIIEKVISGYAKKAGVSGSVRLKYISKKTTLATTIAITNSKNGKLISRNVFVNMNGGLNDFLSDYHNLISTLYHESEHQKDIAKGKTDDDKSFVGLLLHSEVYLRQIEHNSFERTSEDFKYSTMEKFTAYLNSTLAKDFDDSNTKKLVNRFNNGAGKRWGYKIEKGEEVEMTESGSVTKVVYKLVKTKK